MNNLKEEFIKENQGSLYGPRKVERTSDLPKSIAKLVLPKAVYVAADTTDVEGAGD